MSNTTVSRRRAIGATGSLFLGAGLLGTTGTVVAAAPVPPIDRAEALMHELEGIILDLGEFGRLDIMVELDRLDDLCKARDPHALAAERPRNTGANRASVVEPWTVDNG